MPEIIDLSQEIYAGMPVFHGLPDVEITVHATHEEWDGITGSDQVTPAVHRLVMGEHTGTHVDAINHMALEYRDQPVNDMPLTMFYTAGICLDLSHRRLLELIEPADLERALSQAGLTIQPGDTVLLYTDHYRRTFGSQDWLNGPGVSDTIQKTFIPSLTFQGGRRAQIEGVRIDRGLRGQRIGRLILILPYYLITVLHSHLQDLKYDP